MIWLSEIVGNGAPVDRLNIDLDKSFNFLRMIAFLALPVGARLLRSDIFAWIYGQLVGQKTQRYDEDLSAYAPPLLLLTLFSLLTCSTYLSELGFFKEANSPILFSMLVMVSFVAVMLLQTSLLQRLFFKVKNLLNQQFFDLLIFFIFVGVGCFVLLLLNWYVKSSWVNIISSIVYVLLLILFIFRFMRTLLGLSGREGENVLLIFFYLCAVEIAPFLIISKLLANLH